MTGEATDPRAFGFELPCPASRARLETINTARVLAGEPELVAPKATDLSSNYIVNPGMIADEDKVFLPLPHQDRLAQGPGRAAPRRLPRESTSS